MKILLTGGAGYIGTHTCIELLLAGHDVVVFDNFCTSSLEALNRVKKITGRKLTIIKGDIRDQLAIEKALLQNKCEAVIHFAGLKNVGESIEKPLLYYDNNVTGTLRLLAAMEKCNVSTLVFSSSAAVYGEPLFLPISESHPLSPLNPYGRSKLMIEEVLRDLYNSTPGWRISILRYFNPTGAHESGLMGENFFDHPNSLMTYLAQVAVGHRNCLTIWGNDYPTSDGTCVRDFVHVTDLAIGHLKALESLSHPQCIEINLGTGKGHSVLEIVKAFEHASGLAIPYQFGPRRPGDPAISYTDSRRALEKLGWRAERDLKTMCQDYSRWIKNSPYGYR